MADTFHIGQRVRLWQDSGWGEPGCVVAIRRGRCIVHWPDLGLDHDTAHRPERLVAARDGYAQMVIDLDGVAA